MPVRPLTPELAEIARVQLGEDPKKLEDSLHHLKEWIAKQPHLRARTDDQWLAAFLRGCKFSIERAKEKIDLYYSLRSIAGDFFSLKYNDLKFKEILKLGVLLPLPKLEGPTAPRVFFNRSGLYPAEQFKPWEVMAVANAIQTIAMLEDDNLVICGAVNVMDMKDATLAHFNAMTPRVMKIMIVAGQFFLYGSDFEALTKNISKDILPAEYGGNGGTVQEITDYWVKKVEEYSDWFAEDEKFGTDESMRPGKARTAEEMFGVDGSFRQLEFD